MITFLLDLRFAFLLSILGANGSMRVICFPPIPSVALPRLLLLLPQHLHFSRAFVPVVQLVVVVVLGGSFYLSFVLLVE